MYYTYILRSSKQEGAIYIGSTEDLKKRLTEHNSEIGASHTKKYAPWEIEAYVAFSNLTNAKNFEIYLKSNSGKAFLRKRLISASFKKALAMFNNGRGEKVSETQWSLPLGPPFYFAKAS